MNDTLKRLRIQVEMIQSDLRLEPPNVKMALQRLSILGDSLNKLYPAQEPKRNDLGAIKSLRKLFGEFSWLPSPRRRPQLVDHTELPREDWDALFKSMNEVSKSMEDIGQTLSKAGNAKPEDNSKLRKTTLITPLLNFVLGAESEILTPSGRTLMLKIPPGFPPGGEMKVRHDQEAPFLVTVQAKEDSVYTYHQGRDIYRDHILPANQNKKGEVVSIPTYPNQEGTLIRLAQEDNHRIRITIPNMGLPAYRNHKAGDLLVRLYFI